MMMLQRLGRLSSLVMVVGIVSACSTNLPPQSKPKPVAKVPKHTPPGMYRCVSSDNQGVKRFASAKERDQARSKAMHACRKGSIEADTCYISSCKWKGPQPYPVQGQGKFTCYSKNHSEIGVWTATSLDRNQAVAHSMSRCHAHSNAPKACYFSNCRNW